MQLMEQGHPLNSGIHAHVGLGSVADPTLNHQQPGVAATGLTANVIAITTFEWL